MKPINCKIKKHFVIQDSKNVRNSTNRIKKILDASYEKANLKSITSKLKYLSSEEQLLIFKLLRKHEIILVLSIKSNFRKGFNLIMPNHFLFLKYMKKL